MKHILSITIVTSLLATSAFADPIHEAAKVGNLTTLRKALAAGADANAKDDNGATPLHWAAGNGHKEIAILLIAKGAEIVVKDDRFGSTPLHWAAARGRVKVVELFMAKGVDVNVRSKTGNTPQDAAINHKEVAALLRKHGGELGSIHTAARAGDTQAIKDFLAAGADVNAKNGNGFTPLDLATRGKSTKAVTLLRKYGGNSGAEDSILVAAILENIEAVKRHLAAGADVELRCKGCGGTALSHVASKQVLELLIANGADANAKNNNGESPLHHAATKEVAELLIANSADLSAKDDSGETHLHHAAKNGRKEVVELLIAKGADVNAKRNNGQTALHRASRGGHKEVVELLIAKGADVNAKIASGGQMGSTPMDFALSRSHTDIADLLRQHNGKTAEELKAEGN